MKVENSLRLDRLLTLYLFHPMQDTSAKKYEKGIPVLMYHSISNYNRNSVHPYYCINTSPDVFSQQMHYLYHNNYKVIRLNEIENYLYSDSRGKYVAITFDDGFLDIFTNAYQTIKNYKFTATVFLPTKTIGDREYRLNNREHLTWREIGKMYDDGIDFGSHTVTHAKLIRLNKKEIEYEIGHSKKTIETNLGVSIDCFSYPFAFPEHDKELIGYLKELLREYGYKYGVTTKIGTVKQVDNAYFLNRIPVNTYDDMRLFKAKLEGGYDWVQRPQRIYKRLKKVIGAVNV